jgi:hypothetical protein
MNANRSLTNRSTASRSTFSRAVTRAQLSPVAPSLSRDAALRSLSVFPTPLDTPTRWWDPHVVDRLQAPLTRYHD